MLWKCPCGNLYLKLNIFFLTLVSTKSRRSYGLVLIAFKCRCGCAWTNYQWERNYILCYCFEGAVWVLYRRVHILVLLSVLLSVKLLGTWVSLAMFGSCLWHQNLQFNFDKYSLFKCKVTKRHVKNMLGSTN